MFLNTRDLVDLRLLYLCLCFQMLVMTVKCFWKNWNIDPKSTLCQLLQIKIFFARQNDYHWASPYLVKLWSILTENAKMNNVNVVSLTQSMIMDIILWLEWPCCFEYKDNAFS